MIYFVTIDFNRKRSLPAAVTITKSKILYA